MVTIIKRVLWSKTKVIKRGNKKPKTKVTKYEIKHNEKKKTN